MTKYVVLLVLYAVALLAVGYATDAVSPPGANAVTALIAPAAGAVLIVVCAGLSLASGPSRTLGLTGTRVGLLLPLLMASGPALRLGASLGNASEFNGQLEQFQDAAASGVVIAADETVGEDTDFVASRQGPAGAAELFRVEGGGTEWRPAGSQAVGLIASLVLSVFAFFVLLMQRPALPERTPSAIEAGSAAEDSA